MDSRIDMCALCTCWSLWQTRAGSGDVSLSLLKVMSDLVQPQSSHRGRRLECSTRAEYASFLLVLWEGVYFQQSHV
jgi:hypothetical protein